MLNGASNSTVKGDLWSTPEQLQGSLTLYFTARNVGNKKTKQTWGQMSCLPPAVVITVYGIKYMTVEETGSQCWSCRVWLPFPWFGQSLTILNSPVHAVLRDNKLAYRVFSLKQAALLRPPRCRCKGQMICICFPPGLCWETTSYPFLECCCQQGLWRSFYEQKWNQENLGHVLKVTLLVSDSIHVYALSCLSCVRLCDAMHSSPLCSSVHGIL